jgi:hypothetical protein
MDKREKIRGRGANEKCYPNYNKGDAMEDTRMGLNMKERQAVTREYKERYQKATKKEKRALPGEFMRLAGYHREPGGSPHGKAGLYR